MSSSQGLPTLNSTITIGPYQVISELGRGANAVVYKAQRAGASHPVAVKVLMQADPEGIVRFKQEARLANRLEDPGIVGVQDFGRHGRHHYLVMDYVEGQTLEERLRRGPQGNRGAAELCRDLAASMERAHEVGIVHRDLKPANIILDRALGRSRITDFGLARDAHRLDSLTRTGEILGTPYYMAPEQFLGDRDIDHRVDVYALGVILYECLTGQRPFEGRTTLELAKLVTEGRILPPRQLNPEIPAELEAICLRAMSPKREDRYQESGDLAQALEEWLGGSRDGPRAGAPWLLIAAATAAALLAAGLLGWRSTRRQPGASAPARTIEAPPPDSPALPPPPTPEAHESPLPTPPPGALLALERDPSPVAEALLRARDLARALAGRSRVSAALDEARELATNEAQRTRVELARLSYLRRRGRYQEAVDTADGVLIALPGEAAARTRVELAFCHYRLDQAGPALAHVDAVATQPGAAGLTAQALSSMLRSQPGDWLQLLERALALDPDYDHALVSRLFALNMLRRHDEANAESEQLRRRLPDEPRLHLALCDGLQAQQRTVEALEEVQRAIALTEPTPWLSALLTQGELAILLRQNDLASRSFERALAQDPDHPTTLIWSGMTAWNQGRQAEALASYRRAAYRPYREFQQALGRLEPRNGQHVWFQLLNSLRLFVQLTPAAREQMHRRSRAVPAPAQEHLEAVLLGAAAGKPWEELAARGEAAAEAAPDSPQLALELARLLVGRDRYALAREWIARARELGPASFDPELARLEGDLIWRAGNVHDCIPAWETARDQDPAGVEGLVAAAEVSMLRDGDYPAALERVDAALNLNPEHSRASSLRVVLLSGRGEPLLAVQQADHVLASEGALDGQLLSFRAFAATRMFRTIGAEATPYVHAEWKPSFTASAGAYHQLGAASGALLAERADEWEWAEGLLRFALEAEPERAHVHEYLGLLAALRQEPAERVLELWDRAHELEPRNGISERNRQQFQRAYPDRAGELTRYGD